MQSRTLSAKEDIQRVFTVCSCLFVSIYLWVNFCVCIILFHVCSQTLCAQGLCCGYTQFSKCVSVSVCEYLPVSKCLCMFESLEYVASRVRHSDIWRHLTPNTSIHAWKCFVYPKKSPKYLQSELVTSRVRHFPQEPCVSAEVLCISEKEPWISRVRTCHV